MMFGRALKFLGGAALAVAAVAVEIPTEEDVLVLDVDNFDAAIEKYPSLLVEFYAPWCGHCKKLAPEYAAAAGVLKEEDLFIAKVDAAEHSSLAGKYGVRGFPTLKFFKGGNPMDYDGARSKDAIVNYVRAKSGPAAKPLASADELKAFQDSADAVLVGAFADAESEPAKQFAAACLAMNDLQCGIITDAAVAKAASLDMGTANVLKTFDDLKNTLKVDAEATPEQITTFASTYAMKLFTVFTVENAQAVFGGPVKVHVLLFVDDVEGAEAQAAQKDLKELAEAQRGECLHVLVAKTETRITEYFGITEFPAVAIADMRGEMKRYLPETVDLSKDAMTKFEEDFFAGKLTPSLKSEEPEEADLAEPVKVVKGKSFNDVVIDNDKDVLMEFYAPWCGHCKALAPKYDELAKSLEHVSTLTIAKMDSTANEIDHPNVSVSGFPTLLFFPGNDKQNPVTYSGAREAADMAQWLSENAVTKFELKEAAAVGDGGDAKEEL